MKEVLLSFFICSLLMSCSGAESVTDETTSVAEEKPMDIILGKWSMDSSAFINSGVRTEATPPIMPTTWTFTEDGTYKVENSMTMPGTFSRTDDSLFIVLMGVPNDYEILLLDDTYLQLRSTIFETDSASMKTEAFLTRIK